MQFPEADVIRLLRNNRFNIEQIWQANPQDPIVASAMTLLEFMNHRKISSIQQGIEAYKRFKGEQRNLLAELGLGSVSRALPSTGTPSDASGCVARARNTSSIPSSRTLLAELTPNLWLAVLSFIFFCGCVVHATAETGFESSPPPPPRSGAAPPIPPPATPTPPAGSASEPVVCDGNDDLSIINRQINAEGDGVTVLGNCNVLISGSTIIAGGHAVKIIGNGDVRIVDSTIQGAGAAVTVGGNGDVRARQSTFRGQILKTGQGDFIDEGGNTMKE